MEALRPLLSINEIANKIEKLYTTTDNAEIRLIQDTLQELQRLDQGYQIGLNLLNHSLTGCKYFGALTITVFLNTHLEVATKYSDANALITEIVGKVYELSSTGNTQTFIIKKLLSNIGLIWARLSSGIEGDSAGDPGDYLCRGLSERNQEAMKHLNPTQWKILMLFYTIVAEDYKRYTLTALHQRVRLNIWPRLPSLFLLFNVPGRAGGDFQLLGLDCVSAWVIYISHSDAYTTSHYTAEDTKSLTSFLYGFFSEPFDRTDDHILDLLPRAFSAVTELYDGCPRLLSADAKQSLATVLFKDGNFGLSFIQSVLTDSEFCEEHGNAVEAFVNMLIAYLNFNILHLCRNILEPDTQRILELMLSLTATNQASSVIAEQISEQMLSFWDEFVHTFGDDVSFLSKTIHKDIKAAYLAQRNLLVLECSKIYWNKAAMQREDPAIPSLEFRSYRATIGDFFDTVYNLLGLELYSMMVAAVCSLLRNLHGSIQDAVNVEVALFLLYTVTSELTFYDDETPEHLFLIDQVFAAGLVDKVPSLIDTVGARFPLGAHQLRITLLRFLSSLQFYFKTKEGGQYLRGSFNFLFGVILGDAPAPVSLIASKTVLSICQEAPEQLNGFLPQLEQILLLMIENPNVDNLIRERMCNATVLIAHVKRPEHFASVVVRILKRLVLVVVVLVNSPESISTEFTDLEEYATSLISCLSEMAAAARIPDDDDNWLTEDEIIATNEYWLDDPENIKPLVIDCVRQFAIEFTPLVNNAIVTEKCCCILKYGLGETVDGPFKMSLATIVEFLEAKLKVSTNALAISFVFKLVESMVITSPIPVQPYIDHILHCLLIDKIESPTAEFDLVKPAMDVFITLMEKLPNAVIDLAVFHQQIIPFALRALAHCETFISKSVLKFWSTMIQLKRGNEAAHQLLQILIVGDNLMACLGYQMTAALVASFVGNLRLNLDQYYPVFRAMVAKFAMHFKKWLDDALSLQFLSGQLRFEAKQLQLFVSQLMVTRGQRAANDVLKRFWLDANGLSDYDS